MSGAPGRVRILLHLRATAEQVSEIEEGYHRISKDLAGTPGLLGNELLRDVADPGAYAVLSEWESMAAFRDWEVGAGHRGTTSPLRPYQDTGRPSPFALFEVEAGY
ncbi:antibiotic biosynthesis monooxygenase family protein [Streptomyces turgidiscabies]|uniref:Antibiotic biosynthesis monooxygenase n=1 Tax=Streptomyces turgidiscabies (strain Car8) TaxID=698760 RepID=L7F1N0_STRT8|nr:MULTISPECIES: antibiotic biosynthesis monooxygenase [Streptomyces]ELP64505.1 antibiotic biosynthesis monooxygenase [Streptomyces turgidiscabies Car8]MDX3494386.1 antibiotic biosynthesis monooxygenase [Streptomyces turgidiscabies]GAQ74665.1 antibiotic biosynthesis monooxygenase [Streptomyces turgidiscabies]